MTDRFPRLQGRDLTGRTRWLPEAFGERLSLVFVAFRRDQQPMIDSWVPWCAERKSRTGWPSARYRSWDGAGRRCARSSMAAWLLRLVTSRRAAGRSRSTGTSAASPMPSEFRTARRCRSSSSITAGTSSGPCHRALRRDHRSPLPRAGERLTERIDGIPAAWLAARAERPEMLALRRLRRSVDHPRRRVRM